MSLEKFPSINESENNERPSVRAVDWDIYRPIVDQYQKDGFELVETKKPPREAGVKTKSSGIVFLDRELQQKSLQQIEEESQRYRNFVKKIKEDYSLLGLVYQCYSYCKIGQIVQSIFRENFTKEKADRHR